MGTKYGMGENRKLVLIVSIQLMSPVSGDSALTFAVVSARFHSINVPSEWGHNIRGRRNYTAPRGKFPFN